MRTIIIPCILILCFCACDDGAGTGSSADTGTTDVTGDRVIDHDVAFPDLPTDSAGVDGTDVDLNEENGTDLNEDTDIPEPPDAPIDQPEDLTDAGDAATCAAWWLVPVRGSSLERADPAAVNTKRTFRVRMTGTLSGCAERALPEVTINEDTREVGIQLRAWLPQGMVCSTQPRVDGRWIPLRLPKTGTWTIHDLSVRGADTLTISVLDAPRECTDPHEGPCQMDCDCEWGEYCLGLIDGGGETTTGCAKACEIDMDCDGTCTDVPGGIPYTCQDGVSHCSAEETCPLHYNCTDGLCRATFVLNMSNRVPCSCDADCEPGLSCVLPDDPERPRLCERRCGSNSALWCGGGHFCAPAAQDVSGIAQVDSVCGWWGE